LGGTELLLPKRIILESIFITVPSVRRVALGCIQPGPMRKHWRVTSVFSLGFFKQPTKAFAPFMGVFFLPKLSRYAIDFKFIPNLSKKLLYIQYIVCIIKTSPTKGG
jgi:hypothetical protein